MSLRRHQTDSLLVVVVELPNGPRHDDGERYTCGEEKRGRRRGTIEFLFILLRHSDHKIPLRGFHAANMKSLSIFSSFLSRESAGRLPSSVKCNRRCWALIHTSRPGLVSV